MNDYDLHPERLAALFRIGDERIGDLVKALDDPDKEVSLNAQRVIRYLGNEVGLKGLDEYYKRPRKEYWSSGPTPTPLIDWDYSIIKENPSSLREDYLYALALDDSARAKELLASIMQANHTLSADTPMGRFLRSVRSNEPKKVLTGGTDLAKLVLENSFFVAELDKKYASARLIGFNAEKDKAVVEVYINRGVLAEEWWHVVIRKEGSGWRFVSVTQVAVS
jgi:hypothetical protein